MFFASYIKKRNIIVPSGNIKIAFDTSYYSPYHSNYAGISFVLLNTNGTASSSIGSGTYFSPTWFDTGLSPSPNTQIQIVPYFVIVNSSSYTYQAGVCPAYCWDEIASTWYLCGDVPNICVVWGEEVYYHVRIYFYDSGFNMVDSLITDISTLPIVHTVSSAFEYVVVTFEIESYGSSSCTC